MTPRFSPSDAQTYDHRIRRLVPSYDILLKLTNSALSSFLSSKAKILLSGVGCGDELVALADHHPSWMFTCIDPSESMLEIAKEKAIRGGFSDRVTWETTRLEDFALTEKFDAAVSQLVAHFLPDTGARENYLRRISTSLSVGAPFVLTDYSGNQSDDVTEIQPYFHWLKSHLGETEATKVSERITSKFHPINEGQLSNLLLRNGMSSPRLFFAALEYRGYYTTRMNDEMRH
ncbi:MAG: methyltransferase domain-containing protein [Verrucomicrobiota bacterium]